MRLAIHRSKHGFHPRWICYCEEQKIPFKVVNCYSNNIIAELEDCHALMWHYSQGNPKDILIAQQILFSLEHTGFKVFPDFKTSWHFDDKVGQKYLLELIGAPLVPSYIFVDKQVALEWVSHNSFPKVFKLRGGAGSSNVQLVHSKAAARKLIHRAFGRGFKNYKGIANLKERWRKWTIRKADMWEVAKGVVRLGYEPYSSRVAGRERGYVYFQDFLPNNKSDTRIIVINAKAFALKRMVRKNDFRASGSGEFFYAREVFDERCIRTAFNLTKKLGAQCVAYDFVFDQSNMPLVVEISYGFSPNGYDECPGYWDEDLIWHEGEFNPQAWMVELMLERR